MIDLQTLLDAGLNVHTAAFIWFAISYEKRLAKIETAMISLIPKE